MVPGIPVILFMKNGGMVESKCANIIDIAL